jgi:hypothetical protein
MGIGERLTRFVRSHRYIVDGCESDRTACQLPLTSCSTNRNVPSSLKLFCSDEVNMSQYIYITTRCSRTRGLAPTNAAETVWPALKVDEAGTSISTLPKLWPMPGLSNTTLVWTTAKNRQWGQEALKKNDVTRSDIATDVKSGGAGSDGGTFPGVVLSARYDTKLEYLSM